MKPWDIEGKWSVSPYNWAPEVRKEFPLMRQKIAWPAGALLSILDL